MGRGGLSMFSVVLVDDNYYTRESLLKPSAGLNLTARSLAKQMMRILLPISNQWQRLKRHKKKGLI
jgi:hypothetical protein